MEVQRERIRQLAPPLRKKHTPCKDRAGLSCHRFRANRVRLRLSVIAYNLRNLWRRLVLPARIDDWSLTTLQQRLVKTGRRLLKRARYYWLLLAEGHLDAAAVWRHAAKDHAAAVASPG